MISIRAPRVGSDRAFYSSIEGRRHFNPRSPCGERRRGSRTRRRSGLFQSTLPVWEATAFDALCKRHEDISIHAPRVGSDSTPRCPSRAPEYFNPRSPCGKRQRKFSINLRQNGIKSKNKLNRCNKKRHEQHEKSANLSDIHWALKGRTECGEIRVDGANIP